MKIEEFGAQRDNKERSRSITSTNLLYRRKRISWQSVNTLEQLLTIHPICLLLSLNLINKQSCWFFLMSFPWYKEGGACKLKKCIVLCAGKKLAIHLKLCIGLFIFAFTPGLLRFLDHVSGLLGPLETCTVTPLGTEIIFVALWALWSLHHSLGTQHSFPWMVDPTTNVLFSAFFKNSLGLYPYPFSNIDYNLLFLQLSYSLWASTLTLHNLPASSCIKLILAYFSTIQPYKSTLWCPPCHHSLS